MNIHYLQHEPFEDLAYIEQWALQKGHQLSATRLFDLYPAYPAPESIDWLIILGGNMGTYEEERYPWLKDEKRFIKQCIELGKTVLGICLGSQLIAEVLGGEVRKNLHTEIGWFPVRHTEAGKVHPLFKDLPDPLTVFHWHGDTFTLPGGAVCTLHSEACPHQAFTVGDRVVGLQFHFECSVASVQQMVEGGNEELTGGSYVHTADEILRNIEFALQSNQYITLLLDKLEAATVI